MYKKLIIFLFIILTNLAFSNATTFKIIYRDKQLNIYSEDNKDYQELIKYIKNGRNRLDQIYKGKNIGKITYYIYSSRNSFNKQVFKGNEKYLAVNGFADYKNKKICLISIYNKTVDKEKILKTAIHEMVHIFYPSNFVFIREGIANYYSNMLYPIRKKNLPYRFHNIVFYTKGVKKTKIAYNLSGWVIKFIIEECINKDMKKLKQFEQTPENYDILGYKNDKEFFKGFRLYMNKNHSRQLID